MFRDTSKQTVKKSKSMLRTEFRQAREEKDRDQGRPHRADRKLLVVGGSVNIRYVVFL